MILRPNPGRGVKGFSKAARFLGAAAVVATSCAGVLAASPGAAVAQSPSDETIISNFSWLNVAVREGSTSPGTDLIQWTADGGGEQQWDNFHYDSNPSRDYYANINSGLCIATDGVAGDPLEQEPCSSSNVYEQWVSAYVWWAFGYTLYNPASGLDMDVQGASYGAGAEIDGWYPNNQLNQVFSTPGNGNL
jgi:hypothetical protein